MLHLPGASKSDTILARQLYGAFGQTINSVERGFVNDTLLDMADRLPNINLHFSHTLVSCDLGMFISE
jgi:2-polyprenyl-6-methoxyphenol hydroxylase-like FAD-dependent oxidoreductase